MASFTFDGRQVPFQEGDTFATALHRAGILELSRSMKYHRPRGAYCFDGACAGCLVQCDGRPNILACLEGARPAQLESQNRIGTAKRDLLRVTDHVYRRGFDPHGAFTKVRPVNALFMKAVRFMSGVGKAPDLEEAAGDLHEHTADEVIVGGGSAGVRRAKAAKGRVILIEEHPTTAGPVPARIDVWTDALAFGIYDDLVAVRRGADLHTIRAKRITLATGTHQGVPLFANNDLPGVIGARGAERLIDQGVLPGLRVVLHPHDGRLRKTLEAAGSEVVAAGTVTAAEGATRVEKAKVGGRWVRCDAIVCDVPGTPRIELAQQAGCQLAWQDRVLRPVTTGTRTSRKDVHWVVA